jgi:hypothetical protein
MMSINRPRNAGPVFMGSRTMHDTFEARNKLEQQLLAGFDWILERTGSGISINLDWLVGIDLEPVTVQQLRNN